LNEDDKMHADPAMADTQKLELPHDLVAALNSRANKPSTDYGIESLKPSLLGRLMEKLIGPRG
jgi:hypothetical protein